MTQQDTATNSKPEIPQHNSISNFTGVLLNDIEHNTKKEEKNKPSDIFYEPVYNKDSTVIDIRIKYREFTNLLRSMGFILYDTNKPFTFVRIIDNVIEEVSVSEIQNHFINYINNEHVPLEGVTKELILEKIYRNPSHYFCDNRLSLLYPLKPLTLNTDTAKECFLYFNNGFVRCSAEGIALLDYKKLNGVIWRKQKINRNFIDLGWIKLEDVTFEELGVFAKFTYNVAGCRMDRFFSLSSLGGYLLHSHFEYKLKAINLTDSKISDKAEGRTGKTLFLKGLGQVRNYKEIQGKDFDPTNKHKYQTVELGTQLVHINDARRTLSPEDLFNDITEGIQVEKKNKQPYYLRVKVAVSSNKTLAIEGASAKDRFIEYEFVEHYSILYSPKDEFGHWFFTEWDATEWNKFDNFMAFMVCYFLKHGLVEPAPINLFKRKLVDNTSSDFVDFMDDQFTNKSINWNEEFSIDDLFLRFFETYRNYEGNKKYAFTQNRKRFLKLYCEANSGVYTDRRANSRHFAFFSKLIEIQGKANGN